MPASHKAFNGHRVDFVKPSTNQIATFYDLKLVKKNGFQMWYKITDEKSN